MSDFVPRHEHEFIHSDLSKKLMELEKRVTQLEERYNLLKVADAAREEQIGMTLQLLQRIEKKIDALEAEIRELRGRPSRLWDGFVLAMISALMGGIVGVLLRGMIAK